MNITADSAPLARLLTLRPMLIAARAQSESGDLTAEIAYTVRRMELFPRDTGATVARLIAALPA